MHSSVTQISMSWESFLITAVLVLIRISGLMVSAPFFSSQAIPVRIKIGLVVTTTFLLAPVVNSLPGLEHTNNTPILNAVPLLGELAVGVIFGISLNLLNEALLFAGFLLGIEFSFSLINLLDPNTLVETPILGQLLGLIGVLVLISAGLDRSLFSALLHSFVVVPVGSERISAKHAVQFAAMAGGIFEAGLQLAAPVLAATMIVEVTIGLIGRISPQLPVMFISIPLKSIVAYVVLIGSLAIWPGYIENHFLKLLDMAERLIV